MSVFYSYLSECTHCLDYAHDSQKCSHYLIIQAYLGLFSGSMLHSISHAFVYVDIIALGMS